MDRKENKSQQTVTDSKSTVERFQKTTLFYPIAKVLLDKYRPSTDIIQTFEASVDHLEDILSTQSILEEFIVTKLDGVVIKIKYWGDNIQTHSPNSAEFIVVLS